MAAIVVDDAGDVLKAFRQAIVDGDFTEAAHAAHQLKGMLSTFETGSPVIDLQEIIDAARNCDGDTASRRFDAIAPGLRQLIAELAELQNSGNPTR